MTRRKKTLKKKTYDNDDFNIKYWSEMYNRGLGLAAGNELLAMEYANVIQKAGLKELSNSINFASWLIIFLKASMKSIIFQRVQGKFITDLPSFM